MKISDCVSAMQFSPIRKFNPIAADMERDGTKIYHLNIGQPDIPTPDCFRTALRSYDAEVLSYQQSQGDVRLIHAIRDYLRREYAISYAADEIIITMGASEALTMAFNTILNYKDEVLIPEPFYSNYGTFVLTAAGRVRPIPTSARNGFRYADRDLLERYLTRLTRAIVCINPGNPTGLVLSEEEMETIADFAIENDLWVIADEAYREFVFDGRKPRSFAGIERLRDHLILVDSVSKRFSACGARIGYVASRNNDFMQGALKLAQSRLCVPTVDQIAAAELFKLPHSYYEEMKQEYEARRDAAYEEIRQIPDVICRKPGGAFYMTVDLPIDDAEDFLMFMLTSYRQDGETAMFAPAAGFYATPWSGASMIRIAYVLNRADLRRACRLIREGLAAYQAEQEAGHRRGMRRRPTAYVSEIASALESMLPPSTSAPARNEEKEQNDGNRYSGT